jgi:hypothetical protein
LYSVFLVHSGLTDCVSCCTVTNIVTAHVLKDHFTFNLTKRSKFISDSKSKELQQNEMK